MDRKFCVLLYSNYSKASIDLMNFIKKIPLDFPTMVGLTMICIDNPDFKLILTNNNINYVPTLLVEYYNGTKQKFEREYIYMWIDQILKSTKNNDPQTANKNEEIQNAQILKPHTSSGAPKEPANRTFISSDSENNRVSVGKKPDISSIAMEMQKNRELELAEIKETQKPI
jgi:hypothetical protein